MNRLSFDDRTEILTAIAQGCSIQTTCRMTGVSKNTVLKLITDVGKACAHFAGERLRALPVQRVHVAATPASSNLWIFSAIEPETRLVLYWRVGNSPLSGIDAFVADVASRADGRVDTATGSLVGLHLGNWLRPAGASDPDPHPSDGAVKLLKLMHAASLHFMVHNFMKADPLTRQSPAMAIGLAPALWTMRDIVRLAGGHDSDGP